MIISIIANYAVSGNVMFPRLVDAVCSTGNDCFLISRNRADSGEGNRRISESRYQQNDYTIDNYTINIPAEVGGGIQNLFNLLKYFINVFKLLRTHRYKIDVVHAVDLDAGLPTLIFSKLYRKSYIYHIADFYADSRPGIPRFLENLVRRLEIIVINNSFSTFICTENRIEQIKGSNPKRLEIIHNSPVIEVKGIHKEVLNSPIKLCYVGGLSKRRFIKEIVDSVINDKRFCLEIAGYGELEDYVSEASREHNNIIFHGTINYEDAINLYQKGDIILSIYDPSVANHKFSAPNKIYEGMMLGRPVIVARNTGMDSLVKDKEMGIVIDYDLDSFTMALDYIYNNKDVIIEMSHNAAKLYHEFSWDKMKKKIEGVYTSIESFVNSTKR